MGFWSSLAQIGGDALAPFTGGASAIAGNALAGGLDLIGAHNASSAANDAAAAQKAAADQSNVLLTGAQSGAQENIQAGQNQAYGNLEPYLATGSNATTQLNDLMDPNSAFSQGFQGKANLPQFVAPNPQDVLNNPAIQFQLDQGQKAIERSAASKGGLNSAGTLESVNKYAQGVASQGYNDLYSHAQSTWQDQYAKAQQDFANAFGVYQNTQNSRLGVINSGLQTGANAANQAAGQSFGAGGQLANNQLNVAAQQGANLQGGANAVAAGKVAGANAWNGALSNIGNNVVGSTNLYNLNRNSQTSNPYTPVSSPYAPDIGAIYAGAGGGN